MENEKLNEMIGKLWDSLTDEQKAKAKACKTVDELVELAGKEMIELPDELLDAVSGGKGSKRHMGARPVVARSSRCG